MYLMLCRVLPFDADDDKTIARLTIQDDPDFSSETWSGISTEAKQLCQALLVKNRHKRPKLEVVLNHKWFNSYKDIQNEVSVSNIPIGKWFHCTLSVTQNHMNIYINGFLKVRKTLQGIAKQNFGDVYVNAFGGFDGYMSRMRYYDYAVSLSEVRVDVETGPDLELPYQSRQSPPYLTPYWWVNEYE